MSDDDRLAEQMLDLFLYAPIGFALEAKELIPKLADRGRGQVALTRLATKVAGEHGPSDLRGVVEQVSSVVGTILTGDTASPGPAASTPERTVVEASELPVDDYDALTAPQLLPFLSELSIEELAVVADYESAHRGRVTVLNRIRQLEG